MKLQDAYVSEVGVYLGDWTKIGYKMNAQTSSFKYEEPTSGFTDGTVSIGTGMDAAWKATALAALNDCKANETWSINVSGNTDNGGAVQYETVYSDEDNCSPLTPSFAKLNTK